MGKSIGRQPLSTGLITRLKALTENSHRARRARLRVRDLVRSLPPSWEAVRDDLAFRYLKGDGIEIGALYHPQHVPPGVRVRYVDHAPAEELRAIYPEHPWVQPPDIVDEAEQLSTVADASVDFVVANHVLEHVEDPIAALHTLLRVVKPGGIVFLTLPDARHSFDQRRARTTVEHVLRDHHEGPQTSRRAHYEEWAHVIGGLVDENLVKERADEFAEQQSRHHFHVWELETFIELILALNLGATLEAAIATEVEFAVVLRKAPPNA